MNFIQPYMLWGALAVAIPIFIHIWNKQKGKVIEWAASQWLLDETQQQHRGMRLDNILLLILRCLLIILLAFLLSKPIIRLLDQEKPTEQVHLVEPKANVVEAYRFELESALKNGEKIYWMEPSSTKVSDLTKIPETQKVGPVTIQKSVNNIGQPGRELNLYLTNNQQLAEIPAIYVPGPFKLHPVVDSSGVKHVDFANIPKINVLLDYKNQLESRTVQSALNALVTVYSFPFIVDTGKKPLKKYDWILTDKNAENLSAKSLYVLSGQNQIVPAMAANVFYSPESFQIQTSDIVSSGKLPEWLGEALIKYYKLNPNRKPLSTSQLNSIFVRMDFVEDKSWERVQKWLILAFVVLIIIERTVALKKMNV